MSVITELNSQDVSNPGLVRSKKFMFLRLGQSSFALSLSSVREVLAFGQISTLPNMPPYFAGLINLRGKIVSTVYLKKSLQFLSAADKENQSKRPCVIITDINGKLFGAIADDVIEVSAVPAIEIDQNVDGLENKDVFVGIIKRNNQQLAPILNLEKALKLNELIALNPKIAA